MMPTANRPPQVHALAWLLAGALLLPACTPLYAPSAVNAPLLSEPGEVQAGGYLGWNGAGVQTAAALTNHLGVMANVSAYSFDDRARALEKQGDFRKHLFGEAALGYFGNLGETPLRYGVYAGYGRGRSEAIDHYTPLVIFSGDEETKKKDVKGRFERVFVQGSAGAGRQVLGGWLEGGVSLRVAGVSFNEFQRVGRPPDAEPRERRGLFLEPAVSARAGLTKNVTFMMQSGFSMPMQSADSRGFESQPFFASVGVRVNFNVLR